MFQNLDVLMLVSGCISRGSFENRTWAFVESWWCKMVLGLMILINCCRKVHLSWTRSDRTLSQLVTWFEHHLLCCIFFLDSKWSQNAFELWIHSMLSWWLTCCIVLPCFEFKICWVDDDMRVLVLMFFNLFYTFAFSNCWMNRVLMGFQPFAWTCVELLHRVLAKLSFTIGK